MLSLGHFRDRRFSVAAASECLGAFALLGGLFLQTQLLQFDLGYSPMQAGLRILPIAALLVVSAPMSPLLTRLIGVRLTVATGLVAIGAGLVWNATASTRDRYVPELHPRDAPCRPRGWPFVADSHELGRGRCAPR